MTDEVKVEEIEAGLSILANYGAPMNGAQWDKFSNACLRSVATIRALQAENERLLHIEQERDLLRRALVRYGDKIRMSTSAIPALQQVIDDAFSARTALKDQSHDD